MVSKEQTRAFVPLLILFVVIWAVEVVNYVLGHRLNHLGLLPRSASGLVGIPLSPLLHGNFAHLIANSAPLLILGGLVSLRGHQAFVGTTIGITLIGGLAVWLLARNALHVGASGLVFGYFGYLVGRAWLERSLRAIVPAGVAVVLYAGLVWGVLPTERGTSWESHLFGLLAGVLMSRLMRDRRR
ncbi:MAG: rhomboid family intramembrane serine protease [Pseudomonadota bacterium]